VLLYNTALTINLAIGEKKIQCGFLHTKPDKTCWDKHRFFLNITTRLERMPIATTLFEGWSNEVDILSILVFSA